MEYEDNATMQADHARNTSSLCVAGGITDPGIVSDDVS